MSRAKTVEEVREEFLQQLRDLATYWSEAPDRTKKEMCDGLVFSVLNLFDGTTIALPAMDIVLRVHEDDQSFYEARDENWYEPDMIINDCCLHELYFKKGGE